MTTAHDYHVVDVFAESAYAGNPLAVVLDADGLTGEQMQKMAREFNLSETTFVLAPTSDDVSYRARIFTPSAELPFAGHPSVGTAWLLVHLGRHQSGTLVQECGAGLLPIVVTDDGATLRGGTPTLSDPIDAAPLLAALGLDTGDLAGAASRVCGCGLEWAFVQVTEPAVTRIEVDLAALSALPVPGVCAFSFHNGNAHSRCFAGGVGVVEDPATGSAALGLGVFLVATGQLPGDGSSTYEIAQGAEIGRPSRLVGTVDARDGRAVEVRVAGRVAAIATGRIRVPD